MKQAFVRVVVVAILLGAASPGAVAEVGYRGWGPRVGISDNPDQFVVGAHWDLGEFAPHVRWQPSADFGFGDQTLVLTGNLMAAYYFPIKASVTPYAGGQVTAAYFNYDNNDGQSDSDTVIKLAGVGGIEMRLKGGTRFLAEIQLGFGDLPDMKLLVGWTFK